MKIDREQFARECIVIKGYTDAIEISKEAAIDFIKANMEFIDMLTPIAQKDGIQVIDEIYG